LQFNAVRFELLHEADQLSSGKVAKGIAARPRLSGENLPEAGMASAPAAAAPISMGKRLLLRRRRNAPDCKNPGETIRSSWLQTFCVLHYRGALRDSQST